MIVEGDQWRGGILTNNFRDVFLMFFKCMFVCTKCVTIIIVTFNMYSAPYRKIMIAIALLKNGNVLRGMISPSITRKRGGRRAWMPATPSPGLRGWP